MSGPGCSEDRQVRFQGGDKSKQRDMPFSTGMQHSDTQDKDMISYFPRALDVEGNVVPNADFTTGEVDMNKYLGWLKANGYNLGSLGVK